MTRSYSYSVFISIGESRFEVTATYGVEWGEAERGPSYASGGQPATDDQVVDIWIRTVDGKPADDFPSVVCLAEHLLQGGAHPAMMIDEARQQEIADQEDAADARREARFDD